jgi:hypothetical protein
MSATPLKLSVKRWPKVSRPAIPQFQLDPDQIHDLLLYLKTLE